MPVYLHELVETVPGRTEEYLDSMARHQGTSAARRGQKDTMLGLWSACEATGTWPLAVNLWQYGRWDDVAANLARQFEPAGQDADLKRWWLGNLDLRSGGFDRLVESTSYSPDVAALRDGGVGGVLFLHQIAEIVPGKVEHYLAAFGEDAVGSVEEAGARFVGAYRVCLRDHEAITILAFAEAADFARFQAAWHGTASTRLGRWRRREDEWVRGKETLVLRPRYFLRSPWHL
ncbi:MAG: hypothetical protein ACREQ9_18885 [Candidatus Binatia bacterium]